MKSKTDFLYWLIGIFVFYCIIVGAFLHIYRKFYVQLTAPPPTSFYMHLKGKNSALYSFGS